MPQHERPRWQRRINQPEWVGSLLSHQGKLIDWLKGEVDNQLSSIDKRMEKLVATIDDLVNIDAQLADGVQRIAGDFDNLKVVLSQTNLSTEDQAKVDAAVAQAQASVDKINNSDPVQSAPPVDGGSGDGSTTTDPGTGAGDGSTVAGDGSGTDSGAGSAPDPSQPSV